MNNSDKMIAAARRAAKKESRVTGIPYQRCLDLIAVRAGRATWSSFAEDPVPVDADSLEASLEPDFSATPPRTHLLTAVRHASRIGATAFTVAERSGLKGPPIVEFRFSDGTARPIDGRGVSLPALVAACTGGVREGCIDVHTPTVDGHLMRAKIHDGDRSAGIGSTIAVAIDGDAPPVVARPEHDLGSGSYKPDVRPKPGLSMRIGRAWERWRIGEEMQRLNPLMSRRVVSHDPRSGPAIAVGPDGKLVHLPHGRTLFAFSPPGTGRMAGLAVPAILTGDTACFVVHDDGQLHRHTSGHRATLGRVAVIRTAGGSTDSINPFAREWLPPWIGSQRTYLDMVSRALCPSDMRAARVVMEEAARLIEANGGTTVTQIRDAIAADMHDEIRRSTVAALMPLTTRGASSAVDGNTIAPADLRGAGTRDDPEPLTIYIVRDPADGNSRQPLASAIQTAIDFTLMACGMGSDREDDRRMGPCGVCTLHLDFHRSSTMPTMRLALDMARHNSDSIILTASTAGCMERMYGAKNGREMLAMPMITMIPMQSDAREAQLVDGYGRVGLERIRTIDPEAAILSTAAGSPMLGMPMFFRIPEIAARAYARGCSGPPPVE